MVAARLWRLLCDASPCAALSYQSSPPSAWVQDQIFYQLFPDRFHNDDPGLHVRHGEFLYGDTNHPVIAKSWGEPVARDHLGFEVVKGEIRITVPPNTARVLLAT